MNDLLVVELIFQFAPFGRIDSLLSIKKKRLLKYFLLVDAFSSLFIVNAPIKHISLARCSANALFAFHLKGPYTVDSSFRLSEN